MGEWIFSFGADLFMIGFRGYFRSKALETFVWGVPPKEAKTDEKASGAIEMHFPIAKGSNSLHALQL